MSNQWANLLNQTLARLKTNSPLRVAVIGIGHELLGDDAAGITIVRRLIPRLNGINHLLILDGGVAPENQTGTLRRFVPNLVLLIDAAQMDETSGVIRWLSSQNISGLSASTHTLPLDVIAQYLQSELDCEVWLIGIQPAQMIIGAELSPTVKQSISDIVEVLADSLRRLNTIPNGAN